MAKPISTCVWYHTSLSLSDIMNYYQRIFAEQFSFGSINKISDTPSGATEMCNAELLGNSFMFMKTAEEHQPINDAISFVIHCKDQQEIDKYWDYFTNDGKASQCGWCIDKFGLRWQIIPENLGALMAKPGSWEVMMKQQKIVISEY